MKKFHPICNNSCVSCVYYVMTGNSPTVRLLNASTLTAISGSIRLYIAYLLTGIEPDILLYPAAGLIIYSTYTLDRVLESREDDINNAVFGNARRDIGIRVCVITFIAGAGIFIIKNAYLAPFIPFIIGFLYSRGIRIKNKRIRLKGSLGGKNLVIGLTWGGTIAFMILQAAQSPIAVLTVFLFFFVKLFVNSVIYDIKDVRGDTYAGIRTLPVVLGEIPTRLILAVLCIAVHTFILFQTIVGIIQPEFLVIAVSFVASMGVIGLYSGELEKSTSLLTRYLRVVLVDCEAPAAIILRSVFVG